MGVLMTFGMPLENSGPNYTTVPRILDYGVSSPPRLFNLMPESLRNYLQRNGVRLPPTPSLRKNAKLIAWGVGGLLLLVGVNSTWYTVPADSQAVCLRFGHVVDNNIQPGLHFKLPFGIDEITTVAVKRQLKLEFGSAGRREDATNSYQYGRDDPDTVKNMVTGDLNAAHVEWVVQYQIGDITNYLFHARTPEETLRDASEAVMREVVGDRTVDEILTVGRTEMESEAHKRLAALSNLYELGIAVDQVQLLGVNPPPQVRHSFDDVNQAQQEREQKINLARAQYNSAVPQARGEADKQISEAEGNALKRTNEAIGDAARFKAVFIEYERAPEITRRRLYMETMTDILPRMGRKVIIDESARSVLPFLPLNPDTVSPTPPRSTTTTTPATRR